MSFYWRGYFEGKITKVWILNVGWLRSQSLSPPLWWSHYRQKPGSAHSTKYKVFSNSLYCEIHKYKYTITLYHVETQTPTSHLNFTVELFNQWHEQYILREHNICSTARRIRATVASVRKSDKGWRWTPSPVSCHRAWLFTPCHHHHYHYDHGHQYHAASPC